MKELTIPNTKKTSTRKNENNDNKMWTQVPVNYNSTDLEIFM